MSHLFLTGPSGVGKSSLLRETLLPFPLEIRGFFTQRLLLSDHTTGGFRLLPWEKNLQSSAAYDPELNDLFIRKTAQGREKDLSVFATTGIRLLQNCLPSESGISPAIICLDEIGGTELLVPEFRTMLYQVLEEHPCCIGVIKSTENLASMFTRVSINTAEERLLLQLHEDLLHRFDSNILSLSQTNREQVHRTLCSFLEHLS